MEIKDASQYSINNMSVLKNSSLAGCYCCLNIFHPSEIKEKADNGKTAICPKCSVDSVLADTSSFKINKSNLEKLNLYWF